MSEKYIWSKIIPEKYICVHGHFYQPPRENPWLEEVEFEDSAKPYHDWNARVTAECYAPNSVSRIMDSQGRIIGALNNYSKIILQLWTDSSLLDITCMNLDYMSQFWKQIRKVQKTIQDTGQPLLKSIIT